MMKGAHMDSPRLVNLTPHAITIRAGDCDLTVPPSGQVARVTSREVPGDPIGNVPTVRREWGAVDGLPEPAPGTVYLVSSLVLEHVHGRDDVVAPDTGPTAVRDAAGQVVAVRRLVRASS
jgi:hypothetical protein